jgi:hypothetical protein
MKRNLAERTFESIAQGDVPQGRNGKHKQIVSRILDDLQHLDAGRALRIPLADLPDSKEKIRSALNRATRQRNMEVATSSDELHLYVWRNGAHGANGNGNAQLRPVKARRN